MIVRPDDRGDLMFKADQVEWPDWLEKDSFTHVESFPDDEVGASENTYVYCCSIRDLCRGGCASGCYMAAVTYVTAMQTMSQHGDDVFDFIEQIYGEIPMPAETDFRRGQWSGLACWYLSFAVELWAAGIECEIEEAEEMEVADDE